MAQPIESMAPPDDFQVQVEQLGIHLEPRDAPLLGRFLSLLRETNRSFNLTAITEPADMWRRHVLDSLALLPYLISAGARRVVDVGSGGGLPGIPLAIAMPDVTFTLVEATGKKARFLEDVARQLELVNVAVISERAEALGQDSAHRERYDMAIARALGPLNVLLELTVPLVKINGHVLAIKGERAEQEVAAAKAALHLLHAEVAGCVPTPTGKLVIIEKRRATPRKYPRRPGEPKRAPLG
jgi:16S rRNA (guanine527-N7)-methyltransferase